MSTLDVLEIEEKDEFASNFYIDRAPNLRIKTATIIVCILFILLNLTFIAPFQHFKIKDDRILISDPEMVLILNYTNVLHNRVSIFLGIHKKEGIPDLKLSMNRTILHYQDKSGIYADPDEYVQPISFVFSDSSQNSQLRRTDGKILRRDSTFFSYWKVNVDTSKIDEIIIQTRYTNLISKQYISLLRKIIGIGTAYSLYLNFISSQSKVEIFTQALMIILGISGSLNLTSFGHFGNILIIGNVELVRLFSLLILYSFSLKRHSPKILFSILFSLLSLALYVSDIVASLEVNSFLFFSSLRMGLNICYFFVFLWYIIRGIENRIGEKMLILLSVSPILTLFSIIVQGMFHMMGILRDTILNFEIWIALYGFYQICLIFFLKIETGDEYQTLDNQDVEIPHDLIDEEEECE